MRLRRAFGHEEIPLLDPFLLLDEFHSDNPDDYIAGFPWHPHRGIETVTYMLKGEVEHGDSMGNKGTIGPGDIQWMTAGSGIIHQEMPLASKGGLHGFQLWVNLPAEHKMISPRYRGIQGKDIPELRLDTSVVVKIISGEMRGVVGPVKGIVAAPQYFDVRMGPDTEVSIPVPEGHKVFAYVVEGPAHFDGAGPDGSPREHLVIFNDGGLVNVRSAENGCRFLLVSGRPIGERIAWRGPVVMNTQAELRAAFDELDRGDFVKGP